MIIFDTETTGLVGSEGLPLDKQPKIIEFAAVRLDENLVEQSSIEFLCNPGMPLPEEIKKITGIKDSELEGQPLFPEKIGELVDFFLGERIIVAHNCEFDCRLLEFELRRANRQFRFPWPPKRICTVELTLHIKGHRLKLQDLYEVATDGCAFPNAHRAINDVRALATCVRWLRKEELI